MYFSWQLDRTQPILCTTITNAARSAPDDIETLDVDNTGTANLTEYVIIFDALCLYFFAG